MTAEGYLGSAIRMVSFTRAASVTVCLRPERPIDFDAFDRGRVAHAEVKRNDAFAIGSRIFHHCISYRLGARVNPHCGPETLHDSTLFR